MIEIALIILSIGGVLCAPVEPYAEQKFLDEENEAEVIIAVEPLPGVENLHEKSMPILKLKYPGFKGTNNLHERSQIPLNLLGTKNLHEKGMLPRTAISRASPLNEDYPSSRYPKNEYEHV